MTFTRLASCFIAMGFAQFAFSTECPPTPKVNITTLDIFDLSDPDTLWIHRLANHLNIVTKPFTIRNELAFLKEKCGINDQDLQEIERHLRQLRYIESAEATRGEDGEINVITHDKWTLMPTIDLGRKGGKNKFTVGIKDRNLFGYGVDAELEYFKDEQRSGYELKSHFPLFMGHNMRGSILLADTDDGSEQAIGISKPFVSLDSSTALELSAHKADLVQQYFLNGEDYYALDYEELNFTANWGQILSRTPDYVLRYKVGLDVNNKSFNDIDSLYALTLPPDRDYTVPFVELEYLQDGYRELSNVYLINQIEDFNFGWHLKSKFGVNLANKDHDESSFLWNFHTSKGTQLSESTLLLSNLNLDANFGSTDIPRYLLGLQNEIFYKLSPKFGLYAGQTLTLSKNPYYDDPITIGEDSGVRGYPLEFQRGNQKVAFTGELRYYPNINLFNLFELGGAAFVDTGKAFDAKNYDNDTDSWLSSVGIGARIYSPHTSDAQVIHIDVSFPTLSHENVNNVEFLLTTKTSF